MIAARYQPAAALIAAYLTTLLLAVWLISLPVHVVWLSLILGAGLVLLSLIDMREGVLPDWLTLPLLAAGLFVSWWFAFGPPLWHVLGAIGGGVTIVAINLGYRKVRKVDGIGYGDAKLLAASGAWLGLLALPTVLLWACATGLFQVLLMARTGTEVSGRTALAFGPHLAFGTWLTWLFGAVGLD
ncbi:MAG: A24 family peptidase [Pseudomonadota bacterium]